MISPNIVIITRDDLKQIEMREYQRGVKRGEFERGMKQPFAEAMQILEMGCRLFFGRNGDMSHMDTEQFRQAHLDWFTRASDFVRAQKERDAQSPQVTEQPHE
jgi:hypothetical protein